MFIRRQPSLNNNCVGAQGGRLEEVSEFGFNNDCGLIVNAGRSVLFASGKKDFAEAAAGVAKAYSDEMKGYMQKWMINAR